jgi:hypothetical protein
MLQDATSSQILVLQDGLTGNPVWEISAKQSAQWFERHQRITSQNPAASVRLTRRAAAMADVRRESTHIALLNCWYNMINDTVSCPCTWQHRTAGCLRKLAILTHFKNQHRWEVKALECCWIAAGNLSIMPVSAWCQATNIPKRKWEAWRTISLHSRNLQILISWSHVDSGSICLRCVELKQTRAVLHQ